MDRPGTDVMFHPTPMLLVHAMLNLAELKDSDILFDLGSGDGRIVIEAAKRGIKRAVGIEDNQELLLIARAKAIEEIVHDPFPEFILQNFFDTDLSDATVIVLSLDRLPQNLLLKRFVNQLRPGARIISNTHELWEHDDEVTVETGEYWKKALKWVVPKFR